MIRRPPRSTPLYSSAASDVYKRQAYGFAFTASPFWQTPQKEPKGLAPSVRPLAKARRSFVPVSIRGHCPPVCFATTYMQRVRLRRTALRATPRMNTSTQPPDGAGESKAQDQKLSGELTLGLLSGEKQSRTPIYCRSLTCQRWRPDSRPISSRCTLSNCGSELAREAVDLAVAVDLLLILICF